MGSKLPGIQVVPEAGVGRNRIIVEVQNVTYRVVRFLVVLFGYVMDVHGPGIT